MGFFKSLWNNIKYAGAGVGDILKGTWGNIAPIVDGLAHGDPYGAVTNAIHNTVSSFSDLAARSKHFFATGEGDLPGHNTVQDLAKTLTGNAALAPIRGAISSMTAKAPAAVKHLANAGSAFLNGVAKTGSLEAGARAAGATPITKHLANSVSNYVVSKIKPLTGFDAHLHQRIVDPVSKSLINIHGGPSSNIADVVQGHAVHGAAASATRVLSKQLSAASGGVAAAPHASSTGGGAVTSGGSSAFGAGSALPKTSMLVMNPPNVMTGGGGG